MTVLFTDAYDKVSYKIAGKANTCSHTYDLLYADDTMLMGERAREINLILQAIEEESEYYNLSLNFDKCFYIGMNGTANIHFKDGTPVKQKQIL